MMKCTIFVFLMTAIVVFPKFIEVGYGMEPYLTDGEAGRILDTQVLPSLKAADYGKGLSDGARAIESAVIANGYEAGSVRPSPLVDTSSPKLYLLLGLGIASVYAMASRVSLAALPAKGLESPDAGDRRRAFRH